MRRTENGLVVPRKRFKENNLPTFFGADSAEEIADYLADVIGGHQVEFESKLIHQKKGLRHVQVMFVPDFSSTGEVVGIHILCSDITERKVVEQQNSRRRDFSERLIRLNANERDVYELLVRGKSNKTIASELDLGLRTVERRRRIILEKLDINSMAELLQELADIQGIRPV
jgi:DNA-binding CsgD family transcriptional regulator